MRGNSTSEGGSVIRHLGAPKSADYAIGPRVRAARWLIRPTAPLLRRRRKRRQLADVARVVLDDDGRLAVGRDLLQAIDRGQGLRAVGVEPRHAVAVVVLAEVRRSPRISTVPVCGSLTSRLWWPGVCPGVFSITTVPSPNTSLSIATGSTLPSPLIQCANGAAFALRRRRARSARPSRPCRSAACAFGNEATWPV